jgi:hypothetical protein
MRFFCKLLFYTNLYKLVQIRTSQHPFFKNCFSKGIFLISPLLLGSRSNRIVFSFTGLFYYFLKIKIFFTGALKKSFIVVSSNELNFFTAKSVFRPSEASCVFAPRLGFLTNTSNFLSINRISKNKVKSNSFFLLYLGHGGFINVLKESLILNLPVFAIIGSSQMLADVDYPLFGSQSSLKIAYFYCSFISHLNKFSF